MKKKYLPINSFFNQMFMTFEFYAKCQHKSSYFYWAFSQRKSQISENKIRIDLFKYLHPKKLKMNVYSAVQCFFQKSLKSETE